MVWVTTNFEGVDVVPLITQKLVLAIWGLCWYNFCFVFLELCGDGPKRDNCKLAHFCSSLLRKTTITFNALITACEKGAQWQVTCFNVAPLPASPTTDVPVSPSPLWYCNVG